MMDIQVFHKYNYLVGQGKARPLTCDYCGHTYVTRITENLDPVLQCVWCNTLTQPGLAMYNQVLAIVKEHFT